MQTGSLKHWVPLVVAALLFGCQSRNAAFEEAISRSRPGAKTEVNTAGEGLPFFTIGALNPVWSEQGEFPIVRFPDVEWKDQYGRSHRAEHFRNRKTIVAFFFSTCTGFCPMMIQKLKKMESALKDLRDVQFLAISVDPEFDTPERLHAYAKHQGIGAHDPFLLLSANQATTDLLVRNTFATQVVARKTSSLRSFAHSEHFYLLDGEGRLRGVLNGQRLDAPVDARKMLVALDQEDSGAVAAQ